MSNATKPHHGAIKDWRKHECDGGLGFQILGTFVDHPYFAGEPGHTSYVVAHDENTGEIETRNSRYRLEGDETRPKSLGF